jgi:hypothetical protein
MASSTGTVIVLAGFPRNGDSTPPPPRVLIDEDADEIVAFERAQGFPDRARLVENPQPVPLADVPDEFVQPRIVQRPRDGAAGQAERPRAGVAPLPVAEMRGDEDQPLPLRAEFADALAELVQPADVERKILRPHAAEPREFRERHPVAAEIGFDELVQFAPGQAEPVGRLFVDAFPVAFVDQPEKIPQTFPRAHGGAQGQRRQPGDDGAGGAVFECEAELSRVFTHGRLFPSIPKETIFVENPCLSTE